MNSKFYSVHDQAAESYGMPVVQPSKGIAIRQFAEQVNDKTSFIGKHPGDFTLFELGTYDSETGKIIAHEAPMSCGNGVDFLEVE